MKKNNKKFLSLELLNLILVFTLCVASIQSYIKKPQLKEIVKIVEKEVPVEVHDTIPMEVEVEVPYEVEVPVEVEKIVEVKIPLSADTLKIINDYLAQHQIIDTLKLDKKYGYLLVKDVISQNKLKSRNVSSFYNIPEKIVEIQQPKLNQWYIGFGYDFGFSQFFNGANTQVLYKTKSDKMFAFEAGFRNNITNITTGEGKMKPYIGTSMFVKIK